MLVRFWGTRGSLPVALTTPRRPEEARRRAGAGGGPAPRHPGSGARIRRARARLPRVPHVRRQLLVRGARDGRGRLRPVRPRQRRAAPSATTCSLPAGHRGIASTSSCPTCTGTTSWASRSSCPPTCRATTSRIYGCHAALEEAFRRQNAAPSFPVDFSRMAATHRVRAARARARLRDRGPAGPGQAAAPLAAIRTAIGSSRRARRGLLHRLRAQAGRPGGDAGRSWTSSRDADLVIFDAMYSLADAISVKEDWGHSSNVVGVELCQLARAKHLCMFHHEPIFDDEQDLRRAAGDAAPGGDHARRTPRPDLGGLGRDGDRRLKVP